MDATCTNTILADAGKQASMNPITTGNEFCQQLEANWKHILPFLASAKSNSWLEPSLQSYYVPEQRTQRSQGRTSKPQDL